MNTPSVAVAPSRLKRRGERRPARGDRQHHRQLAYQAGLDGLRAMSIIGVLLYHGDVSWAGGGFLGVESFFVLSGFLITSLLLVEWRHTAGVRLSAFWARRARRLLPALFAVVITVGVYYAIAGPLHAVPGLKGDGFAALFYYSNWHQIANGSQYFVAAAAPFQHTWSLSIEEQFYVCWPLLLLSVFWVVRRLTGAGSLTQERSLKVLLGVAMTIAVASAVETAVLFNGGTGLNRVYEGTDTRATGLLTGASLAIFLALRRRTRAAAGDGAAPASDELSAAVEAPPSDEPRTRGRGGALALAIGAAAAFAGVLAAMHFAGGNSSWLFPYGLVGVDLAVGVMIAAVTLVPHSPVSRLFAVAPMRGIGKISYGLYLWHFPLFLWLSHSSTGASGIALLMIRLAVTLVVALVSYFVIEQPVRRRKLPDFVVRPLLPIAVGGAVASLLVASSIGSQLPGGNLAPVSGATAAKWRGSSAPCTVALTNTADYRTVPLPTSKAGAYEFNWILKGYVIWNSPSYPNRGSLTFNTCPPKRVFFVGDSIAFSLGVPNLDNENHYGVLMASAARLGCAFTPNGQILNLKGVWQQIPSQCPNALQQWASDANSFHADVIVVELGYRDEFDWRIAGQTVHLGEPAFDANVRQQIENFVRVLGENGKRRVLFLTVPYVSPPDLPTGAPAPSGSTARHAIINSLIQSVARNNRANVGVLDIDKVISPGNHYNETIGGTACRYDGIHFTIYCASLLQPDVLGGARELLAR